MPAHLATMPIIHFIVRKEEKMSEYRRNSSRHDDRQSRRRSQSDRQVRGVTSLEAARDRMRRADSFNAKWTDEDFAQFSSPSRTPRGVVRRPAGGKRPPRPPKKRRNPKSAARRRLKIIFLIIGIFTLAIITALLCIFLVFKLENIRVEGDVVYSEQDIIAICDYTKGDNLFFLTTTDKEELLEEKLPYIKEAKIRREIPNAIVIEITGAAVVSNVQVESGYLYVSGDAKILEIAAEPYAGIMMVQGLEVQSPVAGADINVVNKEAEEAYTVISMQTDESQAQAEFTKLDLTNQHDIRMWYQDRIEMILGSASWLDYKIRFGLRIVREQTDVITANARGVLDLSLSKEENKAPFAQDYSQMPAEPAGDGTDGTDGTDSAPAFADNPGRGDDIPDYPHGARPPSTPDEDTGGDSGDGDDSGGDDGDSDTGDGDDGYSDE